MSDECDSGDLEAIFEPPTSDYKYRFFNQPIEQIPGWDASSSQLLVHSKNDNAQGGGLQWVTLSSCLTVVTGLSLGSSGIEVKRKKIVVLKDFEVSDENLEGTSCDDPPPTP